MIDHEKINYAGLANGIVYKVHHFRLRAGKGLYPLANIEVLDFGEKMGYGYETYITDKVLVRQVEEGVFSSAGQTFGTVEEAINDSIARLVTLIAESNELYKKYIKK